MTGALILLALSLVAAWLTYANSDTARRRAAVRAKRREDEVAIRFLNGGKR